MLDLRPRQEPSADRLLSSIFGLEVVAAIGAGLAACTMLAASVVVFVVH